MKDFRHLHINTFKEKITTDYCNRQLNFSVNYFSVKSFPNALVYIYIFIFIGILIYFILYFSYIFGIPTNPHSTCPQIWFIWDYTFTYQLN